MRRAASDTRSNFPGGMASPDPVVSSLDTTEAISYLDTTMNSRNRQILEALFADPPPKDLRWDDLVRLVKALGGEVKAGRGSRFRMAVLDQRWVIHRPHPQPVLKRYQIQDVRERLETLGVTPETADDW